ncbi:MAG: PIN domain-containing protein [Candidatus Woesearchaeota archaeon]|nr:PIN domain-containing protein [Candidatus Woesearchaeota archaeon]
MRIVLDSNIVLAALIKDGHVRRILTTAPASFFFPEVFMEELEKYKPVVLEKTGLDQSSYELLLQTILNYLEIIPPYEIQKNLSEAVKLMKLIDVKDAPVLATALSMNAIIWSDDPHLKKQQRIKTFTTSEITVLFRTNFVDND